MNSGLGLAIDENVPDPSTISVTLKRRYLGTDIFHKIFDHILSLYIENELVQTDQIFIDSTHVKANANPHKYVSAYVEKQINIFEEELSNDINEDRQEHGKKALKEK